MKFIVEITGGELNDSIVNEANNLVVEKSDAIEVDNLADSVQNGVHKTNVLNVNKKPSVFEYICNEISRYI